MKVSVFSTWIVGWVEASCVFSVTDPALQYQQHTTEWAIPYDNTKACLHDLHDWMMHELSDPKGLRPHWPIEVRFSDSDDIWLSPSNGRKTCWIGIVQFKYVTCCVFSALPETFRRPYGFDVPYKKLFERFEAILYRHGGRPHWAKPHHLRPETLRRLYPRFDDFIRVLHAVDSRGMFRNEYVERHIFGKTGPVYDVRVFERHALSH